MAELNSLKDDGSKKRKTIVIIAVIVLVCVFVLTAFLVELTQEDKKVTEQRLLGVHVKGAVKNSGYYEVPYGTRIKDLIATAGGYADNAFPDGVNLAEFVTDGMEVYVPYKGMGESAALNLNTVTEEELYTLVDGIGKERARQIIAYREAHGGYKSLLELDEVLGKATAGKYYDSFYIK